MTNPSFRRTPFTSSLPYPDLIDSHYNPSSFPAGDPNLFQGGQILQQQNFGGETSGLLPHHVDQITKDFRGITFVDAQGYTQGTSDQRMNPLPADED